MNEETTTIKMLNLWDDHYNGDHNNARVIFSTKENYH